MEYLFFTIIYVYIYIYMFQWNILNGKTLFQNNLMIYNALIEKY